jgi:hypothetical protein
LVLDIWNLAHSGDLTEVHDVKSIKRLVGILVSYDQDWNIEMHAGDVLVLPVAMAVALDCLTNKMKWMFVTHAV